MTLGLVGRKSGMTRLFTEEGTSVPVTVIEVEQNLVTAIRTEERDGYRAVQLTAGRSKYSSQPIAGHCSKAGVEPGRGLWEFCLGEEDEAPSPGASLSVELFSEGQKVDITGRSRGRGFQSGIRRWNFRSQGNSHGNSLSHRSNGSIGQCQTPGRVWKGKKMSGHMGNARVTVQGLAVIRIDKERNLLLVKGAVPGAPGGDLLICPSSRAAAS